MAVVTQRKYHHWLINRFMNGFKLVKEWQHGGVRVRLRLTGGRLHDSFSLFCFTAVFIAFI